MFIIEAIQKEKKTTHTHKHSDNINTYNILGIWKEPSKNHIALKYATFNTRAFNKLSPEIIGYL